MKLADKLGARYVILLGEDEIKGNFVTVRDMQSKEQFKIEEGLVPFLRARLITVRGTTENEEDAQCYGLDR